MKTSAETELSKQFAHTRPHLPKSLMHVREQAQTYFDVFGLPHRRVEAYKYTDLSAKLKQFLVPANLDIKSTEVVPEHLLPESIQLAIIDGVYVPKLSSARPNGISVLSIEQALASDLCETVELAFVHPALQQDSVVAMNMALKTSVVVVHVQAGVKLDTPLNLHMVMTQAAAFYTHVIMIVEEGAQLEILETVQTLKPIQHNHIMQLVLGAGTQIEHYIVGESNLNSLQLRTHTAHLEREAQYNLHSFTQNAELSRQSYCFDVGGEGACPSISGVQLVANDEHQDITLRMNHEVAHTSSLENFKSVVRDSGRAVFQGKIYVANPAQKTDAKMRANGMLLNEGAEFYAKPELEIYADDVVCAHGATCGAIDDELLFYMQARGIDAATAQALLVQAFVGDALEAVANEELRDILSAKVEAWLL